MPTAAISRQLTSGGENTQPTLSADGRWIIYVSETDGRSILRRISINGGESTQLTDRKPAAPEVSPDGKYIAYFESLSGQPIRLAIIPFAGGESLKTFAVPPSVVLVRRMSWTPTVSRLSTKIRFRGSGNSAWIRRSLSQPGDLKTPKSINLRGHLMAGTSHIQPACECRILFCWKTPDKMPALKPDANPLSDGRRSSPG